jgi:hypothetical protein
MKKQLYVFLLLFPFFACAQNVGIGTTTPTAKLEVNEAIKSKILISSQNFNDTSQLVLKNRTAGNIGTDFTISSNRENGLRISSQSDLLGNQHDSILHATPNGRIGINRINPTERLDVNGNINLTGTIKANGVDGTAGQVLMKNSSGTLSWVNMSDFKNVATYTTSGAGIWIVPSGVTRILVEAWGAGGGGNAYAGGGGGGYAGGFFDVIPGSTINFSIGTAGVGANATAGDGLPTTVTVNTIVLTANGGNGADFITGSPISRGSGGGFNASGGYRNYFGATGNDGNAGSNSFIQQSATTFYEIADKADGGDAGNTTNTGAEGSLVIINVTTATTIKRSFIGVAKIPGGGGGGGYTPLSVGGFGNGQSGAGGMVTFHY